MHALLAVYSAHFHIASAGKIAYVGIGDARMSAFDLLAYLFVGKGKIGAYA